jgi:hypothetical protein
MKHPNLPSPLKLVAHSVELPQPDKSDPWNLEDDAEMDLGDKEMDVDIWIVIENV